MVELGSISVNVDFILDVVYILVCTNPSRSGSQVRVILCVDVEVSVGGSHVVEILAWGHGWNSMVNYLVKVVMNDLA